MNAGGSLSERRIRVALIRAILVDRLAQRHASVCPDDPAMLRRVIGEMLDDGSLLPGWQNASSITV